MKIIEIAARRMFVCACALAPGVVVSLSAQGAHVADFDGDARDELRRIDGAWQPNEFVLLLNMLGE